MINLKYDLIIKHKDTLGLWEMIVVYCDEICVNNGYGVKIFKGIHLIIK